MGELWWVPSLVVFGTTAVIIAVVVLAVRLRRRRAIAAGRMVDPRPESLDQLEIRAGQALVHADDAARRAVEELAFAVAQFGRDATAEFDATLTSARTELGEAFRIRQRLSDEIPDSDAERRSWSERIIELCAQVTDQLREQTSTFDDRRAQEREAPERLRTVRSAIDDIRARLTDATEARAELERRYSPDAYADQADAVATAQAQLLIADGEIGRASAATESTVPAVPALERAERAAHAALDAIAALDRRVARLGEADAELRQTVDAARRHAEDAERLRDETELADAAADIGTAVDALRRVVDAEQAQTGMRNPIAAIDRVRAADDDLDAALARARAQQQRIDNARDALTGALFSARSHLEAARDFIGANRARIGADARTRLAEAERQLALAEAEADPVSALDIARRCSRLAQDADALARYDAGPRTAPIARR